jgi:hypothetical protein
VVEVSPDHHCDLRDLVRGGETFRVHERMGTQRTSSRRQSGTRTIRQPLDV